MDVNADSRILEYMDTQLGFRRGKISRSLVIVNSLLSILDCINQSKDVRHSLELECEFTEFEMSWIEVLYSPVNAIWS